MKIVALLATPRGLKGNTARLLEIVLESARKSGAETETIVLPGGTVLPCRACDVCHKKGVCPQKDDFESIKKKILGADALVLASPNYIFHVSAQLKAFLDRCGSAIHCVAFEGKYGASVVTSGGGDEEPIVEYMNHFLMTIGVAPVGSVWATMGNIWGDAFPHEIADKAVALGEKLVEACENKTAVPEMEKFLPAFKERIKSLVEYKKDDWPYEYNCWKERGLLP